MRVLGRRPAAPPNVARPSVSIVECPAGRRHPAFPLMCLEPGPFGSATNIGIEAASGVSARWGNRRSKRPGPVDARPGLYRGRVVSQPAGRAVRLEPWGPGDLPVLKKTLGDPEQTECLGGPESDEKLAERQVTFERLADSGTPAVRDRRHRHGRAGRIGGLLGQDPAWRRGLQDGVVSDPGPPSARHRDRRHGPGHRLGTRRRRAPIPARVPVDAHENAIARKLGFTLVEEMELELPPGIMMRCNDWCFDLEATS